MLSQRAVRLASATTRRNMGTFARIISFKVDSVDHGHEIDAIYESSIKAKVSDMQGLVSIDRFLCGGQLDYKIVSVWKDLESLKSSEEKKEELVKFFSEQTKIPADKLHLQNFMHKKVL